MCNISRSKHIVTLAFAGLVGATISTAALAMHGGGMGGMGGHQGGGMGGGMGGMGGHQGGGMGGGMGGHQGGGHQGGGQQALGGGTGGHQGGGHKGANKQAAGTGTGGHGGGHKGTNKQAAGTGTGQGGGHKGAHKQAAGTGTGGQQGGAQNTAGATKGSPSNGTNVQASAGNGPKHGTNGKNGGNRWPVAGNNGGSRWPVAGHRWPVVVTAYRPNHWAGSFRAGTYYAAPVYVAPAYAGATYGAPASNSTTYVGSSSAPAGASTAYHAGPSYSGRSVAPSNIGGSKVDPAPVAASPMFVFVKFQEKSSDADKDGFLKTYDVSVVDGPDSDGFYKLRLAKPLPSDQLKKMIESMKTQTAVVSFVDSDAGPTVAPSAASGTKVAPTPVAAADPTFVFVKFQANSSDADKDGFLKTYDLSFVEGPDKEGFFKLRLENTVSPDQLKEMIKSMESQTKVVSEVDI